MVAVGAPPPLTPRGVSTISAGARSRFTPDVMREYFATLWALVVKTAVSLRLRSVLVASRMFASSIPLFFVTTMVTVRPRAYAWTTGAGSPGPAAKAPAGIEGAVSAVGAAAAGSTGTAAAG